MYNIGQEVLKLPKEIVIEKLYIDHEWSCVEVARRRRRALFWRSFDWLPAGR